VLSINAEGLRLETGQILCGSLTSELKFLCMWEIPGPYHSSHPMLSCRSPSAGHHYLNYHLLSGPYGDPCSPYPGGQRPGLSKIILGEVSHIHIIITC